MKDFKKLRIWQQGMNIIDKVYEITNQLPREEREWIGESLINKLIEMVRVEQKMFQSFIQKLL